MTRYLPPLVIALVLALWPTLASAQTVDQKLDGAVPRGCGAQDRAGNARAIVRHRAAERRGNRGLRRDRAGGTAGAVAARRTAHARDPGERARRANAPVRRQDEHGQPVLFV